MAARLIKFVGSHSRLITGHMYSRFGGGSTNRTPRDPADKSRFETLGEKLSGEWINKRIVK